MKRNGEINMQLLEKFCKEYEKHESVKLDISNIKHNAGKTTVMKQLLNALWGKLAPNENAFIVSFLEDFVDFLRLVNDNAVHVTSLDFTTKNLACTTHRKTDASTTVIKNRNVVITSFVTAYARL